MLSSIVNIWISRLLLEKHVNCNDYIHLWFFSLLRSWHQERDFSENFDSDKEVPCDFWAGGKNSQITDKKFGHFRFNLESEAIATFIFQFLYVMEVIGLPKSCAMVCALWMVSRVIKDQFSFRPFLWSRWDCYLRFYSHMQKTFCHHWM